MVRPKKYKLTFINVRVCILTTPSACFTHAVGSVLLAAVLPYVIASCWGQVPVAKPCGGSCWSGVTGTLTPLAAPTPPFPGWMACFTQAWLPSKSWLLVVGSVVLNRGPLAERALGDQAVEAAVEIHPERWGSEGGEFWSNHLNHVIISIAQNLWVKWGYFGIYNAAAKPKLDYKSPSK